MPTFTPYYDLAKPLVNNPTDEDLWGGELNDNMDKIDTALHTIASSVSSGTPSGVIAQYAGSSAPAGWLLCYGQTVSRATYSDLFTAIGTTYGAGDGSTTFGLPDCRGRVGAGKDDMGGSGAGRLTTSGSGIDGATLGAIGGAQNHTLTIAQLPVITPTASATSGGDHSHLMFSTGAGNVVSTLTGSNYPTSQVGPNTTSDYTIRSGNPTVVPTLGLTAPAPIGAITVTINSFGSGNSHPIVQPTIIFNTIIKT